LAIIVVGGSSKSVGKTALICGILSAFPEIRWTAVKMTSHQYSQSQPIWEEPATGSVVNSEKGTDTARFLAAGANRALLITCERVEISQCVELLLAKLEPGAHVIFESNQIVEYLEPDVCIGVAGKKNAEAKDSFATILNHADALVVPADSDLELSTLTQGITVFRYTTWESVPGELLDWLRARLFAS